MAPFPGVGVDHITPDDWTSPDADLLSEMAEDAHYAPYVDRQELEVADLRRNESITFASDLDYGAIPGLSGEMIERLSKARPPSLGAASRVRGVTPAALSAILLHARATAA